MKIKENKIWNSIKAAAKYIFGVLKTPIDALIKLQECAGNIIVDTANAVVPHEPILVMEDMEVNGKTMPVVTSIHITPMGILYILAWLAIYVAIMRLAMHAITAVISTMIADGEMLTGMIGALCTFK